MNLVQVLPKGRFGEMISFEFHLKNRHEKTQKPLWFLGFQPRYLFRCYLLVAGVGLEPHDLRVMSPTSYQLLYPAIYTFLKCSNIILQFCIIVNSFFICFVHKSLRKNIVFEMYCFNMIVLTLYKAVALWYFI